MSRLSQRIIVSLAIALALYGCGSPATTQIAARVNPEITIPAGFARAERVRPFNFPEDHGPHPDFQTEWWYYTGNLETEGGRHFGYQLTFFRRGIVPPTERVVRESGLAASQVYFAHFTLTDVAGEDFHAFEEFARGAGDLAGAASPPYKVWLGGWSVEQVAENGYQLVASQEGITVDLILEDQKGSILQGDMGLSKKGRDPGNASYYYSLTHLRTQGTVSINGEVFEVRGKSWMDHEFSTSALGEDQIGWDWFSVQLEDGFELMLLQIRNQDDALPPVVEGVVVDPEGNTFPLSEGDLEIEVLNSWFSANSGTEYPSGWRLTIPEFELVLEVEPYLVDQELQVSFIYWEGAVQVKGSRNKQPVRGSGYVELTGYAGSMEGLF